MRYVTTPQRGDGFGASFHHVLYDILYAEEKGDRYVLTPQKKYEHNYDKDSNFEARLTKYMGLEELYPMPQGEIKIETNLREEVYKYVEEHMDRLFESELFNRIRDAFFKDKKNPYDQSYYNVAIHIRRPNVDDNNCLFGSVTPNIWYRRVMEYIYMTYKGEKPLKFHIFSQSSLLELSGTKEFEDFNPEYHIDGQLEEGFTALCYADVLVKSLSCYSRTPALLTRGQVYTNGVWIKRGVSPSRRTWIPIIFQDIF
jgi:hypothetical protein